MKRFMLTLATAAIALPTLAASPEKAQEYLDRLNEITDYQEVAEISASQILEGWASMGLVIQEDNQEDAEAILTEALATTLPDAFLDLKPVVEEIYTDEELDAVLEFSQTEAGESFLSKGALVGGKSSAVMQEAMAPAIEDIMPKIMPLVEQ